MSSRISRLFLPIRFKPITFLGLREPDYSPHRPPSRLTHALNPVIPVLEDELAAAKSDDNGRRVPTLLSKLLHDLYSVIPILVVDRA
jgi:hypothetical protein